MNRLRLIPVVIAAASALLLFKAVGLVTHGGYMLVGTQQAVAESGAKPATAEGGGEATATTADPTLTLATDVNATDTSPTVEDTSLTLPASGEAAAGGEGGGHSSGTPGAESAAAAEAHSTASGEAAPAEASTTICPEGMVPADPAAAAPANGEAQPASATDPSAVPANCVPAPQGQDAVPMMTNGGGETVPVSSATAGSEPQIIERLGERRDALDKRESELATREGLVQAAEKQLEERAAALKALEEQISSKVQSQSEDTSKQFTGLVTMYETMKPKDAAIIFSQLDLDTLVRVAKAMNPKKMAPILAKMDTAKAEALTAALAAVPVDPAMPDANPDPNALPQIVGN